LTELRTPAVIVNFKVYREVEGKKALALSKLCQEVAEASGVNIVVCPPTVELSAVVHGTKLPVMAQHVDPRDPGSATGWVTAEMVKAAGAVGTLINHSEHRLPEEAIVQVIRSCRKNGLISCVCADTSETSGLLAKLGPDMIAIEPPELIGGEVSVTNARPEVVERAVAAVHRVDAGIVVLCGAGVKTGEDVKRAIQLGARGVLLASGVVKAKDPRAALEDLVRYI